ncbi:MAG: hypothetical protein OHK0023_11700 [Anaerolineae bacterium]
MFRFDETDPSYLIAFDGTHESDIANYQDLMQRWIARLGRGTPFGVILVTEPHDHAEGLDHPERNIAFEEAFTKLLNDFRRDHKANIERCTLGFARVLPAQFIEQRAATDPNFIETVRASTDRLARYMWGIAGNFFGDLGEAKAWLDTLAVPSPALEATPLAEVALPTNANVDIASRVGLFYGSTTGVTELAALRIQAAWEALGMGKIEAINIANLHDLSRVLDYECLIFGIPTWNVGQLQDDWQIALPKLGALDFSGKKVALFGVGDQYGYPENFLDAVGILGTKLIACGATLVGRWYDPYYEFSASKAFVDAKFMGLALDEVQQAAHSQRRINAWVRQIIDEFALQPSYMS